MFWYEDEIKQLERKTFNLSGEKKRVLFYGSSSIRLWNTVKIDFPDFTVINQAFGGSTFAACCWFFKRIVPKHKPDIIVLYAGDNDLGDGRHPEEVFYFFKSMMALISENCGDIPVAYISVKPSLVRLYLYNSIEYTNTIIRKEISEKYPLCSYVDVFNAMLLNGAIDHTLYEADGLHLSPEGYKVWARELETQFLDKLLPEPKI
ncbi:MAG: hypothetical protein JZU47_00370 [Prolixibacteraceae bacterium]|nr:hypothetical protein [Prolixibacteraceae bacterium]